MKVFNIIERGDRIFVRDHERNKVIEFGSIKDACLYIEERRDSDNDHEG